jgi:hypothetical protein
MRTPLLAACLLTASVVSPLGEIYAYWEYDDPAGTGFWEAENSASDVEFPKAFASNGMFETNGTKKRNGRSIENAGLPSALSEESSGRRSGKQR